MKKYTENPLSRQNNIVVQELNGEVLIYDLKRNKAFCLNETLALVWQLCDGKKSISNIRQKLSEGMNQSVTEDLVRLAINQLKEEELLATGDRIKTIDAVSRREIIRKIGFTSMIALPLISSLAAPSAAMAASPGACGNTGANCLVNTECCSNYCDDCFTGTCQPDPGGLGGCL